MSEEMEFFIFLLEQYAAHKSETADKIGDIQSEMTANQETIQSHEQQITEIRERIALLKEQISQ